MKQRGAMQIHIILSIAHSMQLCHGLHDREACDIVHLVSHIGTPNDQKALSDRYSLCRQHLK